MLVPKQNSQTVRGLSSIGSLFSPAEPERSVDWWVDRLKMVQELSVLVLSGEHANCDSLPLRYGIHYPKDTQITLKSVKFMRVDPTYSDRFHIDAQLPRADGVEVTGRFVVGCRRGHADLVVVTVWLRNHETEARLSEVMTALRKREFLTPEVLQELHPLYVDGKLSTSADLICHLSQTMSALRIDEMQSVVNDALAKADSAIAERDEALALLDGAQSTITTLTSKVEELEAEKQQQEREKDKAKLRNEVVSLSAPNQLADVLQNQMHRGSSCTILVLADGSKRYMKTATFDSSGQVTTKAKSLIRRTIRISSWDPVSQPGRWSREGYFRNVYAAE